jgi:hypothetical protein
MLPVAILEGGLSTHIMLYDQVHTSTRMHTEL